MIKTKLLMLIVFVKIIKFTFLLNFIKLYFLQLIDLFSQLLNIRVIEDSSM
jgi:hypothetical protein